MRRLAESVVEVNARGEHYSLQRRVEVKDNAIEITDTLYSLSPEPVGMMTRQDVICNNRLQQSYSAGGAETPFQRAGARGNGNRGLTR